MRLSDKRIKELQVLLKEQTGREYSSEQAQQVGLSVMRFVFAKHLQAKKLSITKNQGAKDDTK